MKRILYNSLIEWKNDLSRKLLALRGWQRQEINGIEYELNSIITEKWEDKAYRLVIQRERRLDGEQDLWEGFCVPLRIE